MAENLLNQLGQKQFQAFSAGSFPTGTVHPKAIETLQKHGIETNAARSKSWDEFTTQSIDIVITVCDEAAGETCPIFPGAPEKQHWSTPDPAKATGTDKEIDTAFETAFQMLKNNIEKLVS